MPPRKRRRRLTALVLVVILAVTGGAVAWWAGRDGGGPLAGRPRVTDTEAGLSYAIPEGWTHDAAKDKDLISAFTSQISKDSDAGGTGASAAAGRSGQVVPRADLPRATERAARSNAEFFFPDQPVKVEDSRTTTVDGQPAHTVTLTVLAEDGTPGRLEMTVVTEHRSRTSFVLGMVVGSSDPATEGAVDAILASTTLT
ncbi:hypothetical protein [Streptomyces sp. NPDC003393]